MRRVDPRSAVLTVLVLVTALVVGAWVTSLVPIADDLGERPFVHEAAVGDEVLLRTGTVTVTGVRAANELAHAGQVAATEGVWLLADVTFDPRGETRYLPQPWLVTPDGTRYGDRQALTLPCGPAQPGLPVVCTLALELPSEALEGAHLWIPADHHGLDHPDDILDVDLALDAAAVQRLTQDLGQVTVEQPKVVGR